MPGYPRSKTYRLVVRDGLVIVKDLAAAIGMDRSNLLKALKRAGITTDRRRSTEAGNQFVSVIRREDAERFIGDRNGEFLGSGGEVAYLEIGSMADNPHVLTSEGR
jgi:hypothetical protein